MKNIANINSGIIPSMSERSIDKVRQFESFSLTLPQVKIDTFHTFHAGLYARTIMIPAGVVLTGALIKIATILIINGDVIAYIGDDSIRLSGYNVLPAEQNRKQAFVAQTDTYMTMLFSTNAKTIEDAENEFTDEASLLFSRKGESKCLVE
jgi:hypothetical protein